MVASERCPPQAPAVAPALALGAGPGARRARDPAEFFFLDLTGKELARSRLC